MAQALSIACQHNEIEVALVLCDLISGRAVAAQNLLDELYAQSSGVADTTSLLQFLKSARFRGPQDVVSAQCSDLFWVLENRQGIPISLAVIAMGVAHACGLRASGVNFPGHFLLDVEGDLVDPVTMQPVAGEQIQQLLQRLGGEVPTASLLRRTQPADVALRMLNNLKALALQTQDYEETLQLLDLQLAIAEGTSAVALQVERGNVWLHLGHKEVASQCFTLAASQTDDEALLAQIFERLQSAGGPEGVLH